jgi:hypothetical protein
MVALAAQDKRWLADHPPAGCYRSAHDGWASVVDAFAALGRVTGGLPGMTGDQASSALTAAVSEYRTRDLRSQDAMDMALTSCK